MTKQHYTDILKEFGYEEQQIERLWAAHVARGLDGAIDVTALRRIAAKYSSRFKMLAAYPDRVSPTGTAEVPHE